MISFLTEVISRPIIVVSAWCRCDGATRELFVTEEGIMKKILLQACIVLMAIAPVHAIDPGVAKGTLQINGKQVALTHAYAHLHDNAEGLLDFPKELRIVLSDQEVPQESLRGIAFLPVTRLAREGKVQGILIRLDPADRHGMYVTLLHRPADPGMSLLTLSRSDSAAEVIRNFRLGGNRVSGVVDHADTNAEGPAEMTRMSYSASFGAPLFQEPPVTADLKGKPAQNSPQMKVLREKAAMLKSGNFEGLKPLMSRKAWQHMDAFLRQAGAEAKAMSREMLADLEQSLPKIQRVVVRGETAIAIIDPKSSWFSFVKEGGEWKTDD